MDEGPGLRLVFPGNHPQFFPHQVFIDLFTENLHSQTFAVLIRLQGRFQRDLQITQAGFDQGLGLVLKDPPEFEVPVDG